MIDYIALDEDIISYCFVGRARLFDRGAHVNIEVKDCVVRDLRVLVTGPNAYNTSAAEIGRDYVGAIGIIMNKRLDDG